MLVEVDVDAEDFLSSAGDDAIIQYASESIDLEYLINKWDNTDEVNDYKAEVIREYFDDNPEDTRAQEYFRQQKR